MHRPTTEAQEFKLKFEEAMDINSKLLGTLPAAESDGASDAADELADEVAAKATVA